MIRVEKDDGVNFRADKWLKKMKKIFQKNTGDSMLSTNRTVFIRLH